MAIPRETRHFGNTHEPPAERYGQGETVEQEVALLVAAKHLVESQEARIEVETRAAQSVSLVSRPAGS